MKWPSMADRIIEHGDHGAVSSHKEKLLSVLFFYCFYYQFLFNSFFSFFLFYWGMVFDNESVKEERKYWVFCWKERRKAINIFEIGKEIIVVKDFRGGVKKWLKEKMIKRINCERVLAREYRIKSFEKSMRKIEDLMWSD